MKLKPFYLLVLLLAFTKLEAQWISELGVKGGISFYYGDLAKNSTFLGTGNIHPSFFIFTHHPLTNWLGIELEAGMSKLSAFDNNTNDQSRNRRNLNFESQIAEANIKLMLTPVQFQFGRFGPSLKAYGALGIGVYHFNPYTYYQDEKYFLQPLGTEGQGLNGYPAPYSLTQINIPICGGLKIDIRPFSFGFEMSFRKLFTDYLDDVSDRYVQKSILEEEKGAISAALADRSPNQSLSDQPGLSPSEMPLRGQPSTGDGYGFICLKASYLFNNGQTPQKKIYCPKF